MDDHGWAGWPQDDPDGGPDPDPGAGDPAELSGDLHDPGGLSPHGYGDDFDDPGYPGDGEDGAMVSGAEPLDGGEQPVHGHLPIGYGDLGAAADPPGPPDPTTELTGGDDLAGQPAGGHPGPPGPVDDGQGSHGSTGDGGGYGGFGVADPPVGTDPDAIPFTDADLGPQLAFPPALDLDALGVPEPVDGYPWADPGVLGDGVLPDLASTAGDGGVPLAADLAAYAGEQVPPGGDAWAALAASDDPAASALARWWRVD